MLWAINRQRTYNVLYKKYYMMVCSRQIYRFIRGNNTRQRYIREKYIFTLLMKQQTRKDDVNIKYRSKPKCNRATYVVLLQLPVKTGTLEVSKQNKYRAGRPEGQNCCGEGTTYSIFYLPKEYMSGQLIMFLLKRDYMNGQLITFL